MAGLCATPDPIVGNNLRVQRGQGKEGPHGCPVQVPTPPSNAMLEMFSLVVEPLHCDGAPLTGSLDPAYYSERAKGWI